MLLVDCDNWIPLWMKVRAASGLSSVLHLPKYESELSMKMKTVFNTMNSPQWFFFFYFREVLATVLATSGTKLEKILFAVKAQFQAHLNLTFTFVVFSRCPYPMRLGYLIYTTWQDSRVQQWPLGWVFNNLPISSPAFCPLSYHIDHFMSSAWDTSEWLTMHWLLAKRLHLQMELRVSVLLLTGFLCSYCYTHFLTYLIWASFTFYYIWPSDGGLAQLLPQQFYYMPLKCSSTTNRANVDKIEVPLQIGRAWKTGNEAILQQWLNVLP